jgi:hypothetical protein
MIRNNDGPLPRRGALGRKIQAKAISVFALPVISKTAVLTGTTHLQLEVSPVHLFAKEAVKKSERKFG